MTREHLVTGQRRPRMVPLRRIVPSLLTTVSLCCGLASLHFALRGDFDRALSAIAVAAVFDMLDGGAARLLRASSRFGAMLDSLSDFASFGVAPAVLLHQWMLRDSGAAGLAATMIFALGAALRLARFTAARRSPPGSPLARFFVGLPTPAAAGIVLIPVMLETARTTGYRLPEVVVILHTFFVAWLMTSRQPCFSLKKLRVPRQAIIPLMIAAGLGVVAASKDPWGGAAVLATIYLLTIPLSIVAHRRIRAEMAAQASAAPAPSDNGAGAPIESRG